MSINFNVHVFQLAMLHVNGFVRELKYTPVNVNQHVGECECIQSA